LSATPVPPQARPTCASTDNLRKHGDFKAAQILWLDPALLEIPARTTDEERFLVIARLRGKH
jgi:uncharacterized DUF497 family protein